jgi:hypothetical protein
MKEAFHKKLNSEIWQTQLHRQASKMLVEAT